jgi:hypothetical protein
LDKFLQGAGLKPGADYQYTEVKGLEHNEPAWATRVETVLTWLFAAPAPTTQSTAMAH